MQLGVKASGAFCVGVLSSASDVDSRKYMLGILRLRMENGPFRGDREKGSSSLDLSLFRSPISSITGRYNYSIL